ncbi:MAG: FecR family protein [Paludibacter sp.]|nr:FecR family protein [Paludibacter sp.]
MKNNIDNLLARYFGGNASEQDMLALEQWISLSDENQLYFDELTNLYAKLGNSDTLAPKPNIERARKTFKAYISSKSSETSTQIIENRHYPFYRKWMFQAASILIILMLSVSVWLVNSEHDVVFATQLTLKQSVLPDQTQIKLSKNSKIIYSSKYGKKSRKIRLEGKAYFAVGHKGTGSLQINADETFIEDIGTKFTVSAYPDSDKVSVNVNQGKVHFYTTSNRGLILTANETGIYNKSTKEFTVVKPDTVVRNITHIQFNGVMLKSAMEIISKKYDVYIHFNQPDIAERKITVNFDGENIDMVLQVIAETLDLTVNKDANGYILSNSKKLQKQ